MKKLLFTFLCFASFLNVNAYDTERVELAKCVDGDTAHFYLKNERIKTRFLAIDTPESTKEQEPYGLEASAYTCNMLTNAKMIQIKYDPASDITDKYDRHLVWVYVDGVLLQELLVKEGLAEVKYLYDNYEYNEYLLKIEKEAKANGLNMWSQEEDEEISYLYLTINILLVVGYSIVMYRKKNAN